MVGIHFWPKCTNVSELVFIITRLHTTYKQSCQSDLLNNLVSFVSKKIPWLDIYCNRWRYTSTRSSCQRTTKKTGNCKKKITSGKWAFSLFNEKICKSIEMKQSELRKLLSRKEWLVYHIKWTTEILFYDPQII